MYYGESTTSYSFYLNLITTIFLANNIYSYGNVVASPQLYEQSYEQSFMHML